MYVDTDPDIVAWEHQAAILDFCCCLSENSFTNVKRYV